MTATVIGRVIATFGRHLVVRTAEGAQLSARPFGRTLGVVCGDEVRARVDRQHEELHVIEVLPRRNALWRANARGGAEAVVANLTQLLVVLAPLPLPDLFVTDRYLCAATAAALPATLIVYKSDLGIDAALAAELDAYAAAGYAALACSAASAASIPRSDLFTMSVAGMAAAVAAHR